MKLDSLKVGSASIHPVRSYCTSVVKLDDTLGNQYVVVKINSEQWFPNITAYEVSPYWSQNVLESKLLSHIDFEHPAIVSVARLSCQVCLIPLHTCLMSDFVQLDCGHFTCQECYKNPQIVAYLLAQFYGILFQD
ncbi:hypothetical protein BpHYR1_034884 [Brachionus plicatilis]|uniref:Uncharacterized protein n=1 Tax=Brachionus plicatilis TaxID=10195 RepID=A0A3M7R093_BRAPC|nr:hypothetical protein BpHYR1_034884 [Brachionus plicatilis]